MIDGARYVHTHLIARDWQALSRFYQEAFGCVPVPPERDERGPELEAGTGIPGARLRGVHLRLPGWGENRPTLEIFAYDEPAPEVPRALHRPGLGHIAFQVDDVAGARDEVLARGGRPVGELSTLRPATGAELRWCDVFDPEGNGIEPEAWS